MTLSVEDAIISALNDEVLDDADRPFAHAMAERHISSIALTPKQRRALWRMLKRYGVEATDPAEDGAPATPTAQQLKPRKSGVSVRFVADGERLAIIAPFRYKDVIKALPGRRWHPNEKYWSVPATPVMADMVARTFPGADLDGVTEDLVRVAGPTTPAPSLDADGLDPIPVTLTEPWPHQLAAYHFAADRPATMLAMDMGTGKTKVAVDVMVNNGAHAVLIQCPKSVCNVWSREFRVHSGQHFHVEVLTDMPIVERARKGDDLLHECRCGRPHALVINYEAAWQKPFGPWALAQDWDYVVFDESHRIKAPNGTMSKFCAKLRQRSKRALALSGTPMAQSPLDIWGQYRSLNPDIFGPSHTSFKYRYAIMGGWQGKEIVGLNPNMEEELARLYFSIAFEVDSSVLDLEESIHVERTVKLSPKAARVYKDLESDLYAEIGEDEVTVPNVLVKILRLQQVTGGIMRDDQGKDHEISTDKADLLQDVLADIEVRHQPVVVFCRFIHDLDVVKAVCKTLKYRYGELAGRRNDLTEDAKMPEDVDVMGVQIQAGGVGIDLTRAKVGIYYSIGHSLSDYKQSLKRLDRPGQVGAVTFVHLMCEGTIDEDVYEALRNNQEVIDRVLDRGRSGG